MDSNRNTFLTFTGKHRTVCRWRISGSLALPASSQIPSGQACGQERRESGQQVTFGNFLPLAANTLTQHHHKAFLIQHSTAPHHVTVVNDRKVDYLSQKLCFMFIEPFNQGRIGKESFRYLSNSSSKSPLIGSAWTFATFEAAKVFIKLTSMLLDWRTVFRTLDTAGMPT